MRSFRHALFAVGLALAAVLVAHTASAQSRPKPRKSAAAEAAAAAAVRRVLTGLGSPGYVDLAALSAQIDARNEAADARDRRAHNRHRRLLPIGNAFTAPRDPDDEDAIP